MPGLLAFGYRPIERLALALRIAPSDLLVDAAKISFKPLPLPPHDPRPQVQRRLPIDSLPLQGAMVERLLEAVPGKMAVCDLRPIFAEAFNILPLPHEAVLLFPRFELVEPVLVYAARRDQKMRVQIAVVALAIGRMDGNLHNPALAGEFANMILQRPAVLLHRQLVRQADDHPFGDLGMRMLLEGFEAVPEGLDILPTATPARGILRGVEANKQRLLLGIVPAAVRVMRRNLGDVGTLANAVVVALLGPPVIVALARQIGRTPHSRAAALAADAIAHAVAEIRHP